MKHARKGSQDIPDVRTSSQPSSRHYIGSIEPWHLADRHFRRDTEPSLREREIAQATTVLPPGWPIGFEQYLVEGEIEFGAFPVSPVPNSLPWTFNVSVPPSTAFYAKRPHSELAAYKAWEFIPGGMTFAGLRAAHWALGLSGQFRSSGMSVMIAREGPRVDYLHAPLIDERITAFLEHVNDNPLKLAPLHLAVTAMIDFLIIHPFEDGNGRMARLMFQWTLARHGILAKPILPLLPAIRKARAPHLLAIYNWEFENDPLPLVDFVNHAIPPTLEGLKRFIAGSGA
jgi:hypothetical protein